MTSDFEEDGYVTMNMKVYVQKILDELLQPHIYLM
jgi:hypothetical protein